MSGAGHPGLGPDIRDLMSRNLRDFALQELDVWLGARMSGPTIPDRDLDFKTRFGAEMDDFGGQNLTDFVDGRWGNLGRC